MSFYLNIKKYFAFVKYLYSTNMDENIAKLKNSKKIQSKKIIKKVKKPHKKKQSILHNSRVNFFK